MAKKVSKKEVTAISPTSSKKKAKAVAIDGLGPVELMKLRNAMRQVWQRSKQWKTVKSRCKDDHGYDVCELCKERVPKIKVDHIVAIGDMLEPGFIERLMVPSSQLQGICDTCHKPKTKKDNAETKAKKKAKPKVEHDTTLPVKDLISTCFASSANMKPLDHEELDKHLDEDIKAMDIYTYEKIAMQLHRDMEKSSAQEELILDDLI